MKKQINYFETYEITDLKDMLEKTTKRNLGKIAFKLKDANGRIKGKTFLEFKKDVEALVIKLIDMGLENKRIAVMGKNSYGWAISYLAATIVGVVVPIDKEASDDNLKEFLIISNSKAIVADSKYLNKIEAFKLKSEILLIDIQNTSKYINLEDLIIERKKFNFKW